MSALPQSPRAQPGDILLSLAGTPTVRPPGAAPQPLAPRDAALLAWLALEGPTPRSRLAALLWPGSEPEAARNALRQRLFQLRRQCGGAELVAGGTALALAPGVAHDLADADGVLGDAAHEHSPEYAAWLAQQRERRRARVRSSIAELADMAERARDWPDALSHAQELLALEPLSEDAHRRVMRLHYLAGDRSAALLAFDRCERTLKDEIGTRPSAETLALLATIEAAGDAAPSPAGGARLPASIQRPPRLVGRRRELAALHAAWAQGRVLALVGEAGQGKSRLLQAFIEPQPGVAYAAARPGDAGVPYATLARLLRAVLAPAPAAAPASAPVGSLLPAPLRGELARLLPELGEATPRRAEAQGLALQGAVSALIADADRLAGLAVDDLHFADAASLEMLRALVDAEPAPGRAPLRWALAFRPAEAATPLHALQDALAEQARLAVQPLGPLSEAELAELVDTLALTGVSGAALAPALLRATGGNPLFVLETLKQAWTDGALDRLAEPRTGRALVRPATVGLLIERRLAQLSPGALMLARVASLASVDFGIALAEAVLGVPALQFADALNELDSAQVLRDTAFVHDLVFETVRASVPPAVARHTHGRIAAYLEQAGGEPARVAAHWLEAGDGPRALPWLGRAAEAAEQALRDREQVGFLLRKAEIEESLGRREAAFDSLVAACHAAERFETLEGCWALCDRVEALAPDARRRVVALMLRAHQCGLRMDTARGEPVGREALREARAIGDPALVAEARLELANTLYQTSRLEEARELLESAAAWIDAHGTTDERRDLHNQLAIVYDNLGRLDDALPEHRLTLALCTELGVGADIATTHANLACNRIDAGDYAAAHEQLLTALRSAALHEDLPAASAGHRTMLGGCAVQLGRYDEALDHFNLSLPALTGKIIPAHGSTLLHLAQLWLHLGQPSRAGQALDDPIFEVAQGTLSIRARHGLLRARLARALSLPAGDALDALLAEAEGAATVPYLALPLRLEQALGLAGEAACAACESIVRDALAVGHRGSALAAHLRAAQAALDIDPRRALRHAETAWALAAQGLEPAGLYRGELWLHAALAARAAGDGTRAAGWIAAGRAWVQQTAERHVPEPFRHGFLHANPVNRRLLTLG